LEIGKKKGGRAGEGGERKQEAQKKTEKNRREDMVVQRYGHQTLPRKECPGGFPKIAMRQKRKEKKG